MDQRLRPPAGTLPANLSVRKRWLPARPIGRCQRACSGAIMGYESSSHRLDRRLRCVRARHRAIGARPAHAEKLFFIQRSKNANEVHYDARVNADGTLDARNLVDGYWLNKAEDGSRQAITIIQKIAYGWSVEANGNGTHLLKLKAFPDRALTLLRVGARWRAQMAIAGKPAYMTRLYIATDEFGCYAESCLYRPFWRGRTLRGGGP